MIQSFPMSEVTLTDPYLSNAFEKEREYLSSLDCDRLLSFFRKTRGLAPKAESYSGWESTEIRGHTLGHYLTALAQAYAASGDTGVYDRLRYLVSELSFCQFENGYLSAFPEEFFDRVENREPVWVPWYTMHKIIAGLISAYTLAGSDTALRVVSRLGDWVYQRVETWSPEIRENVLSVEYGGMNDCMYELYKITGDEKHAVAAHAFDETELFMQIRDGRDILNNRHANTTIPKFLGSLNRYLAFGERESFYLDACRQFWRTVTENHSYVTGGNSESEHFGEPNILDAERTAQNCETCNTYNMLKMSRTLFQITGERKYADFYERVFFNAILSSQNPATGMTMYFQPMATGYFKVYGRPFDDFWCCTGTGMESFSKLNDSLYFHEGDRLFVNLYLSSSVRWAEKGVRITQDTDIPNTDRSVFKINTQTDAVFTLCFRIPDWSKGIEIEVNGSTALFPEENGYAAVRRLWSDNDSVRIRFKLEIGLSALPDQENTVAFTYGPYVLSAGLGTEKMDESNTGIMVRIAGKRLEVKDYLILTEQRAEAWKSDIANHLIRTEGKLEFKLKGTDEDERLLFTPHYRQSEERYGIYWKIVEKGSPELEKHLNQTRYAEAVNAAEIDGVRIGNDQYELSHRIQGKETEAGDREGYHYRVASPGGWFSYDLRVRSDADTYLRIDYIPGACKGAFDIYVNDRLLSREKMEGAPWNRLIVKTHPIPAELIGGKDVATVAIRASACEESARIVDVMSTTKEISFRP